MRKTYLRGLGFLLSAIAVGCSSSPKSSDPVVSEKKSVISWTGEVLSEQESRYQPAVGTKGMVVSDSREASEWGAEILRQGGNAVDAAVGTAFMLAVTRPHYAALGGGGFFVFCPKPTRKGPSPCEAIDYRETAPAAAKRDMYLRDGKPREDLPQNGALAPAVPGTVAGLLMALQKFGTMTRKEVMSKPIEVAKKGFRFTARLESSALDRWTAFNGEAKKIFGCDFKPCPPGTVIKQHDLARVLEAVLKDGERGFYRGWVAQKIAEGLSNEGGIITTWDLANYKPKLRTPVQGEFGGMQVISMPPPSAGGTVLLQLLQYAEMSDRKGALKSGPGAADTIHALAQGMVLAYADRAKYFGDPDFVKVPVQRLLSSAYLAERWKMYEPGRVNVPSTPGDPLEGAKYEDKKEFQYTTHFSVIDKEGNAVALTTTVNDYYGSGFVPPGTGVVMNNEMDDFSIQPGVPNAFGLVGTEANAIAPGKRPLSSMSPTIVRDSGGNARIVIGAAGGPRITTSVFLSLVNRLRFGMSITDGVAFPRFHHQWKPNELRVERFGFAPMVLEQLKGYGYSLKELSGAAKIHALERFPNGRVWGAPDFRGEGAAVAE